MSTLHAPDVFKTPLMLCECMLEWMHENNPMYIKDKSLKDIFYVKYHLTQFINNNHDRNKNEEHNNTSDKTNNKNDNDRQETIDRLDIPAWDWHAISKKMLDRGIPYSPIHCAVLWKYIAYGKKYNDISYLDSNTILDSDEDMEDPFYQPFTAIRRFSLCKNSENPQLFLPSLPGPPDILHTVGVSDACY